MRRELTQVVAAGCLLFAQGTRSLAAEPGPAPVEFSSKPAEGLKMRCWPEKKAYPVGSIVRLTCEITNVSNVTKPFGWAPDHEFGLMPGEEIPTDVARVFPPFGFNPNPGVYARLAGVSELVTIGGHVRGHGSAYGQLVLYLAPGARIYFRFCLGGRASEPRVFRGRFRYDPGPLVRCDGIVLTKDGTVPGGLKWVTDHFLYSNVVEFTVVEAEGE